MNRFLVLIVLLCGCAEVAPEVKPEPKPSASAAVEKPCKGGKIVDVPRVVVSAAPSASAVAE